MKPIYVGPVNSRLIVSPNLIYHMPNKNKLMTLSRSVAMKVHANFKHFSHLFCQLHSINPKIPHSSRVIEDYVLLKTLALITSTMLTLIDTPLGAICYPNIFTQHKDKLIHLQHFNSALTSLIMPKRSTQHASFYSTKPLSQKQLRFAIYLYWRPIPHS